ncbi:hypothetical protein TSUD_296780 [Trifolium subterraneum]|uniref:Integrase catalytic domain-containing protein n=1 Tax=Trifolium subterraneum TaxID=3900 RepID=A0A2Z6PKM9_TRISU|nr:hypothetical protein TSUD_296780 [Trifolium subterraneum]
MKENESLTEYFARTLAIANKMSAQGERLTESNIVEKILRSMTSRFEYVVCSIEEARDVTVMSIDEFQSSLLVHEGRMKVHKAKDEEQALKVSNQGRGSGANNGSRGRGRNAARSRGRGHYQYECPTWEENANFAAPEFNVNEEMLMMAHNQHDTTTANKVWFLDSGCSNHMIGTKDWLFDFDDSFRETVKLGDDSTMPLMGKGSVKICIEGIICVITDVYYLPNLRNNLLSIGQLQQKNLTIVFSNNVCKIFHEERGLIVSTPMTVNRMYILMAPVITPKCLKMNHGSEGYLWHCRYGHLSLKVLNVLAKKEMVKGLPLLQESQDICDDYVIGKHQRDTIPKSTSWRASEKLELIHSDICGPINPSSNGGCRYFITFIDDYSRKTWTYPLKEKSSAFEVFKRYKALIEKESNQFIKCLRTDRGGEFTSSMFNEFCSDHVIKRQLTAAYTPQQNGVSERKNRTLMNMVRSMLNGRNVPKKFWPEAVVWATYVLSRCPTLSVKGVTPQEAWSNVKPSVSFFKVFGCIAYSHVPDAQRKKLDPKSIKCVHLGISKESKAYKLYDPSQQKIIISRDFVFDENQGWDWEEKNKKQVAHQIPSDDSESSYDEEPVIDMENEGEVDNDDVGIGNNVNETIQSDGSDHEDNAANTLPPRTRNPPDPITYEEAAKLDIWRKAMDQEIKSIEKNSTWELVDLPKGVKKIGVKWIYKTKFNENGEVDKHKARLVAKGYTQQHGIDFNEVFAPVARWDTIRTILAIAPSKGWTVYQLDVKSALLHGDLVENVYVDQPPGYNKEIGKVYKLRKALYGLKQAPRAWYSKIKSYFNQEKFEKCPHEHTLFVKQDKKGNVLIVSLYVDDLIYTGNNEVMFGEFKQSMKNKFSMTDLVCSPIVPGNKLIRDENGKIVDVYGKTYRDTSSSCQKSHEISQGKSTSGYVFMLGSSIISWSSKKQAIVTLSTTEAEFVAAASCACQSIWLRRVLEQLRQKQGCIKIHCDNSSSIKLSKNPVMHGRCKHIDARYHFLRDLTKENVVELVYCNTQDQVADVMTKALKLEAFCKFRDMLGIHDVHNL